MTATPRTGPYIARLRAVGPPWSEGWLHELGAWIDLEEEPERSRLARALESGDNAMFFAAAFELFLTGHFHHRGWGLQRHPPIQGSKRVPDYLVHAPSTDFYAEAVLGCEADAKSAHDRVRREVADALEPVEGAFWVHVSALGAWDGRFSKKKVRQFLERQVREVEQHPEEPERTVTYRQDPFLPVRFEIWRNSRVGPVARGWSLMLAGDMAAPVTTPATLSDAVDRKVGRYGVLGLPLVVFVYLLTDFPADSFAIRQALFGTQNVHLSVPPRGPGDGQITTSRNGIFTSLGPGGKPIRTRLSAVGLYHHAVEPPEVHRHELVIFHNPFAAKPLDHGVFAEDPQCLARARQDGIDLAWTQLPPGLGRIA